MKLPYAEPFRIKMVEEIYPSTREQRETWLKKHIIIYLIKIFSSFYRFA
jgi:tryptophanase